MALAQVTLPRRSVVFYTKSPTHIRRAIREDVKRARHHFHMAMRAKARGNDGAMYNYIRAVQIAMRTARQRKSTLRMLEGA